MSKTWILPLDSEKAAYAQTKRLYASAGLVSSAETNAFAHVGPKMSVAGLALGEKCAEKGLFHACCSDSGLYFDAGSMLLHTHHRFDAEGPQIGISTHVFNKR